MKGYLVVLAGLILVLNGGRAQERPLTNRYSLTDLGFSPFGGTAYQSLNPGHEVRLAGTVEGRLVRLTQVPLNQTTVLELLFEGRLVEVPVRLIEERRYSEGRLVAAVRDWVTRHVESGDLFLFGEERALVASGEVLSWELVWRADQVVEGGLLLPARPLVGARFRQGIVRGSLARTAEIISDKVAISLPFGEAISGLRLRERSEREGVERLRDRDLSPGIGLVREDESIQLEQFQLGTQGVPKGARFVAYSLHSFFPLLPGIRSTLAGIEDGLRTEVVTEVLNQTRTIQWIEAGEVRSIDTRVVEVREYVNGSLFEQGLSFFAQCVDTRDVYIFGEEVTIFLENGSVATEGDSWLVGVDGAQAGLVMPGNLTIGATYLQEQVPDFAENLAEILADAVTVSVPVGVFEHCLEVVETSQLFADEEPSVKLYAPGIGLVDDEGILKLTEFHRPGTDGPPVISIDEAVQLRWSEGTIAYRVEQSADGQTWSEPAPSVEGEVGRRELIIKKDKDFQFFRLVSP